MRVIKWLLDWWFKPTPIEMYLAGHKAGAAHTRKYAAYPPFWAHERSVEYDAFDQGWDDGVSFVLAQKEAADARDNVSCALAQKEVADARD